MKVIGSGRTGAGTKFVATLLGVLCLLLSACHDRSASPAGGQCSKSSRVAALHDARAWRVALPEEAGTVYRCADGKGGGLAGQAHFKFSIPRRLTGSYFASMGVVPLAAYDVRDDFADLAHWSGSDLSRVKKYQAGSKTRGNFDFTVFVDEDSPARADVYVEVVCSG
ncbi:hypothetical protein [Streptomyces sp. NPDC001851]|uniref:hypothetical protein n=1 Tax=Streptomyces sp. NPDC001851 TaxID=3154529 RepID=UPI00332B133B